jgi:mannose-6-phosphate isomerase
MRETEAGLGVIPPEALKRPLKVAVRPVYRPYLGGDRVRRFRGLESVADDHWTEEWVGSVIPAANLDPGGHSQGLTVVSDPEGRTATLRHLVDTHPEAMLGPSFLDRHGADIGFLVKIISLGQVGPVHAHPNADFARRFLETDRGQAEAWILLGGGTVDTPPIEAGVGFRPGTRREDVHRAVGRRSSEDLRSLLHGLHVRPGDAVMIRPGSPHYLGNGPLFIEIQQPSDASVVADYWTVGITEKDATLGLDWERALDAFDFEGRPVRSSSAHSAHQRSRIVRVRGETSEVALLESDADELFDVRFMQVADELEVAPGRFSVCVVTGGDGYILGDWGRDAVKAGDVLALPASLAYRFAADRTPLQIHRCMGPAI